MISLADFQPLSAAKTNIFFHQQPGLYRKTFQWQIHAILIEEVPYKLRSVTAPVYLK